jgi:hypothetical protein
VAASCWFVTLFWVAEDNSVVAGAAGLWRQQLGVALWASCGVEWWWRLDVRSADGGEKVKLVGAPPQTKIYCCWCGRPVVATSC